MSHTLGDLIRERRLGQGLSLGQLATKAATSAAEVRSWERGAAVPGDAAAAVLSELLEIDVAAFEQARTATGAQEDPETPTEQLSAASGVAVESVSAPVEAADLPGLPLDTPPTADALPDAGEAREEDLVEPDRPDDPPEEPGEDDVEPDPTPQAAPEPAMAMGPTVRPDPEGPRLVPLRYPQSAPAGVAVEVTETAPNVWNPLRYLYDPDRPWLYWIRAAATVLVLLILVSILFDSVGELFDKIGQVIDSVEPADGVGSTTTTLGG